MAFCGNCGAALTQSTGFCGNCGTQIAGSAPPANAAAAPPSAGSANSGWSQIASQPLPVSSPPVQEHSPAQASSPQSAGWTPVASVPASAPASAPSGNPAIYPGPTSQSAVVASGGLTPNLAGALAYSIGALTGVLFLVLEPYRRDRFVRFHAMQSILYFLAAIAFHIVWSILVGMLIGISGWVALVALPVRMLIALCLFGLWLFAMYQAYMQREFRIPILGAIASRQAG